MVIGIKVVWVEEEDRYERYLWVDSIRWWVGSELGGWRFRFTGTVLGYVCSFIMTLSGSSLYSPKRLGLNNEFCGHPTSKGGVKNEFWVSGLCSWRMAAWESECEKIVILQVVMSGLIPLGIKRDTSVGLMTLSFTCQLSNSCLPVSVRVGHDWATSLSHFTFMHWRRKWQPTPVFLPGESQGRQSLVGSCLWGRTESDTTEAT